jgi:hypothetical protein
MSFEEKGQLTLNSGQIYGLLWIKMDEINDW